MVCAGTRYRSRAQQRRAGSPGHFGGEQREIKSELAAQKALSDKREANGWRADVLRFNLELVEHTRHTREDYIEILDVIDKYETYCDSHKDYENNRAVHAIANIERCYDDRLKNNDFA